MPMTWDNVADAKLFAAIVATSDPKFDYPKIAALMGPECTAKAVTHRITKLREIAKTLDTTAATTQTPVKRVRTPKAKTAKSDGDEDDDESPTKKVKTTTKTKKTVKKAKADPDIKEEDEVEESTMKSDEVSGDD